jgi:cell division protein FtsN
VGKKAAAEKEHAAKEHGDEAAEAGGGTLGKDGAHGQAAEHGEAKPTEAKHGEHAGAGSHDAHKDAAHGEAKPAGDDHSPETAAKSPTHSSGDSADTKAPHEAVDKNSDEYLLNALKEAGVEPPGGKAPKSSKLPDDVKETKSSSRSASGTYVIQVGSHPTRAEAETQVRQLKGRRITAEILPPFKDKQGEWHRVVVGSYKNKRDADKEAASLKGKGSIVSFFVWRLP